LVNHWTYLRYVLKHKWFVFVECYKLGIPWLGFVHDWSKFLSSEWWAYVRYFHGNYPTLTELHGDWRNLYDGLTKEDVQCQFDIAWLYHQHRNKHHWQYWILVQDEDENKLLEMPDRYQKEMLADWRGAGLAIFGKDNTKEWYQKNKDKMQLHPNTRKRIEAMI